MSAHAHVPVKSSQWQVSIGAEGIAAAQFARAGFDVSIQSGRDKPSYDLVVANAGNLLKVSVNGSEDGSWALTQSYLKRAGDQSGKKGNCQGAINLWLDHHGARTVCCLVQFHGVSIDELPRIYIASPHEIAQKLRETADRLGISNLYEKYEWMPSGEAFKSVEELPSDWIFSEQRIQELLAKANAETPKPTLLPRAKSPAGVWTAGVESRGKSQAQVGLSA